MKKKKLTEGFPNPWNDFTTIPDGASQSAGRYLNLPDNEGNYTIQIFVVGGDDIDTDTATGMSMTAGGAEHDAQIEWQVTDGPALRNSFHEYSPEYPLITQFIDAAMAQPNAVFGFRSGNVNLPILLSFRTAEGTYDENAPLGLCIGTPINGEWFSTAGPDGDEDADDPRMPDPQTVESTVTRLLSGLKPVKEGSDWLVALPRHRQTRGLAESIPTGAAEYLAALPEKNVSIHEGETFRVHFRFEEDAEEFIQHLEESDPVIEKRAEQIAFLLLKE